jgi:hypothetical protein
MVKHILGENGIRALAQSKLINKPLFYNNSGGCAVTYGLRLLGIYHHGPFDWVIARIKSFWDPQILKDDLINFRFHETNKKGQWLTESQNCYFIHENLSDEKTRNKLIKRADDLILSLNSSNPPIPIRLAHDKNVPLMDLLWADDINTFRQEYINKIENYNKVNLLK